jgi:hypothetical protein
MRHRRLCCTALATLVLLTAITVLAGATQAHEPRSNDEPPSRYAIETATDISLALDGWEKEPTLDREGAYVSVTVANERDTLVHNVTVAFTGTPAGVEVTKTEAHVSAETPNHTVRIPHVEAGQAASFGMGLDASGADPGGMDLQALILFEDDEGTRYAGTEEVPLTIEGTLGIPGPSAAALAALLAATATVRSRRG